MVLLGTMSEELVFFNSASHLGQNFIFFRSNFSGQHMFLHISVLIFSSMIALKSLRDIFFGLIF